MLKYNFILDNKGLLLKKQGNRTKIIYSYILLFCLSFQLSVLPQIPGLQNEILKEDVSAPFQPETGGKIFIS
jgi:hypothetical protein